MSGHDAEALIAFDEIGGAINRIDRPDQAGSGLVTQIRVKRHGLLANHRTIKNGLQARCQPRLSLAVGNGDKIGFRGFCGNIIITQILIAREDGSIGNFGQ